MKILLTDIDPLYGENTGKKTVLREDIADHAHQGRKEVSTKFDAATRKVQSREYPIEHGIKSDVLRVLEIKTPFEPHFLSAGLLQGTWWMYYGWISLIGVWLYLGSWYWRKRRAGALIQALGPMRRAVWFGVAGCFSVMGGVFLLADALRAPDSNQVAIFFGVALLSVGCCLFSVWFARIELREQGLWSFGYLLPWQSITSYEWKYERGWVLILKLRTALRTLTLRYPLTSRCKDEVELHLPSHLSKTSRPQKTER